MAQRIADRVHAARRSGFVGREPELAQFSSLLRAAELPVSVLFLFGPGGVGKTTLLRRFADLSREAGVPVVEVDARDLEPTPEAVRARLRPVPGVTGRQVLLLDTYELLGHLDDWLRRELLPELPADALVVLAGRDPPAVGWRVDAGWRSLLRPVPLRNLSPAESRAYLRGVGVPDSEHSAVVEFTHGHPLALAVVADDLGRRGGPFDVHGAPDVLKTLLDNLLQTTPDPAHGAAIEACAQVRATTEPLLAALLDVADAHEPFEWLRRLSFIEPGRGGIAPHDAAREILAADLRWRDPSRVAVLHERARRYYLGRLDNADDATQQAVLSDLLYLHRDNPVLRPYLRPLESQPGTAGLHVDRMRAEDLPALQEMVARHEGARSAALAEHWLQRQPQGVRVVRAGSGEPVGFLALLALTEVAPQDRAMDPAVAAAWSHLDRSAPLRPGELATLARFWMAAETYQDVSPVQGLLAVELTRHYLTTSALAVSLLPVADSERWAAFCAYADLVRAPLADFTVEGRGFEVYGHDWRAVPPAVWVALLGERETALAPLTIAPPASTETLLVLSRAEFADRVRAALRELARRDRLQHSPLLRSRLVASRVDPAAPAAERVAALQDLVREAAEALRSSPRDVNAYRALHRAYLAPAASLEKAAEALGLPSSTFRRHLGQGITRLTEILWQQEVAG